MTPDLRARMGAAAVEAAKAVGYGGAGTVEFIADGTQGLRADALLVHRDEHAASGRASGDRSGHRPRSGRMAIAHRGRRDAAARNTKSVIDGYAVEARLYAEDPECGFLPSTGTIVALALPDDIRVDSGVEAGGEVTPYLRPDDRQAHRPRAGAGRRSTASRKASIAPWSPDRKATWPFWRALAAREFRSAGGRHRIYRSQSAGLGRGAARTRPGGRSPWRCSSAGRQPCVRGRQCRGRGGGALAMGGPRWLSTWRPAIMAIPILIEGEGRWRRSVTIGPACTWRSARPRRPTMPKCPWRMTRPMSGRSPPDPRRLADLSSPRRPDRRRRRAYQGADAWQDIGNSRCRRR